MLRGVRRSSQAEIARPLMQMNRQPKRTFRDAPYGVRRAGGNEQIIAGLQLDGVARHLKSGIPFDDQHPLVLRLHVLRRNDRGGTDDPLDDQTLVGEQRLEALAFEWRIGIDEKV